MEMCRNKRHNHVVPQQLHIGSKHRTEPYWYLRELQELLELHLVAVRGVLDERSLRRRLR